MAEATSPRGWMWLVGIPITMFGLVMYFLYAESVQQFARDFLYWLDYSFPSLLDFFE